MPTYLASPRSRDDLRELTKLVRNVTEMGNSLYFPIVNFIESVMCQIFPEFHLIIGEAKDMGNRHGITCRDKDFIMLRSDVYEGACRGEGRDRFTCAHELGHYLLHNNNSIVLARMKPGEKVRAFEDPEWQASAFAGELLVPAHLIKGLKVIEIVDKCGVSLEAALIQKKQLQGIQKIS